MSKYHPYALRNMALEIIAAWNKNDPRYELFINSLQHRTGLHKRAIEKCITSLAGY